MTNIPSVRSEEASSVIGEACGVIRAAAAVGVAKIQPVAGALHQT